jgi:hypothetical protein
MSSFHKDNLSQRKLFLLILTLTGELYELVRRAVAGDIFVADCFG